MERFGETWKRKGQDESDTGDKNKVEDLVKTWLVFFEKNLNKIANLDQKTCKNKTMKGKLGNDSMTTSLYKINKSKLSKVRQSKPCNNSRLRSWLCCCKDSKLVYFKWTVLDFVSEIASNLFILFTIKLFHKILFNFLAKAYRKTGTRDPSETLQKPENRDPSRTLQKLENQDPSRKNRILQNPENQDPGP